MIVSVSYRLIGRAAASMFMSKVSRHSAYVRIAAFLPIKSTVTIPVAFRIRKINAFNLNTQDIAEIRW